MGITKFSYDTLVKHGAIKEGLKMLELGDQNLYFNLLYGQCAKLVQCIRYHKRKICIYHNKYIQIC